MSRNSDSRLMESRRNEKSGHSRYEETRTAEQRDRDIRNYLMTNGANKFALPKAPEGWVYHFARVATLGEVDPTRLPDMEKGGWQYVPIDRHPEYKIYGSYATNREAHAGRIVIDNMVLMERKKEYDDLEKQRIYQTTQNLMMNVQHASNGAKLKVDESRHSYNDRLSFGD